jgi:hypothetical protein
LGEIFIETIGNAMFPSDIFKKEKLRMYEIHKLIFASAIIVFSPNSMKNLYNSVVQSLFLYTWVAGLRVSSSEACGY